MNTLPTGFELTTSTLTRQLVPLHFQLSYTAFPDNLNKFTNTTYSRRYNKFSFSNMPSYIKNIQPSQFDRAYSPLLPVSQTPQQTHCVFTFH